MLSWWLPGLVLLVLPGLVTVADPLRWRWSHPAPHGNNVIDMAKSEALSLWVQVAEQGAIYTRRSGGFWTPRESGTMQALRAVTFLGERVVITGEAGTVLYADEEGDFQPGVLTDGPTEDWLEGVTASADLAVAVGDNGAVYTSDDGVVWTARTSGSTEWLRGVAYGGDLFVVVGDTGTVLTSPDGLQWASGVSGTQQHLNRVRYVGSGFVAVGDGGTVLFSPQGTAWSSVSMGAAGDLYAVGASGTDLLVAGDEEVWTRIDGVWGDELAKPDGPQVDTYLSCVGDAESFLIAGRTGTMAAGFRLGLPAYEWFSRSSPSRSWLFDLVQVEGLFVAVGDQSMIMTSVDGVDWAEEFPPSEFTNTVFLGVGGTTNLLVGAGAAGSLMISPNAWTNLVSTNGQGLVTTQEVNTIGVIWQAIDPSPVTEDLQGVCFWGDRYYVVGDAGVVLDSADGTNWLTQRLPTTKFLSSVAGAEPGLVIAGVEGALFHSPDGANWSDVSRSTTNWIYRVRHLNDRFLAVGRNGVMWSSSDGLSWQGLTSGTTSWLTDATYIAGRYYVVGLNGVVLASDDAVTWTVEASLPTMKSLYAVANDNERLVVAGAEGVILRSPVNLAPTPVEILAYSRDLDPGSGVHENLYLFGGQPDQRFTLDRRAGWMVGDWEVGLELELFDGSGTLYYLESVTSSNAPPEEYYRTSLLP